MGSLYLWSRSIQEMGGDVVIGRSIYGVVVIDGSLCSRFYGMSEHPNTASTHLTIRLNNTILYICYLYC